MIFEQNQQNFCGDKLKQPQLNDITKFVQQLDAPRSLNSFSNFYESQFPRNFETLIIP